MMKQVVGTVMAAVATAMILNFIGINADGEPIPDPPASDEASAPHFAPQAASRALRLEVVDGLTFDQGGWGHVQKAVTLTIGGMTQELRLTRSHPRRTLAFELPGPGRYPYFVRVTTEFNDHGYANHPVPCYHTAERQGTVQISRDATLSLVSGFDRGVYAAWLQDPNSQNQPRAHTTRQPAPPPVDSAAAAPSYW